MKIKVTLKDPNGVDWALEEAVRDNPEQEAEIRQAFSRAFKYGEYLTIELDTENGRVVV